MADPKLTVKRVPMMDTGLGIEAGYANDAELVAAGRAQREKLRAMLTPEAWERLEAAEREAERRFIEGENG